MSAPAGEECARMYTAANEGAWRERTGGAGPEGESCHPDCKDLLI
jgi:hypothetical protein